MKKVIATKNAPAAIGPYSQAVQVGNMLFASGQLGLDPATDNFAEGGERPDRTGIQECTCNSGRSRP